MTTLYVIYIIIMKFNPQLAEFFTKKVESCRSKKTTKKDVEMQKTEDEVTYGSKDMQDGQKKGLNFNLF